METSLKAKRALVCGSTRGLGRAIAHELADLGASVTLFARNKEALQETCKALPSSPDQQHDVLVADFQEPASVRSALDTYSSKMFPFHILINNTGGPPAGPIFEADIDAFRVAFNQHVVCNQILAQALVPGMKKVGYGRIINVISISVRQPIPGLGVSNTIRGAVASWAKTLAFELAPFGITVNNVLPGYTLTDRLQSLIDGKAKGESKSVDEVSNDMKGEVPMGRFAEPSEVAQAAAFLASPAASYITGLSLPVDGGRISAL